MSTPPISRYPVPKLEDLPDDIRSRILEVQEKSGFVPNVFLALAHRPAEWRAFFAYPRCADGKGQRPDQGRARDDRGRHLQRQRLPVLRGRPRRHPAHSRQEQALVADQVAINHRKADITPRQKAMLDFAMKVALDSAAIGEADYATLHGHGFNDEDIWDIGAVAAFFGLSNRMANMTGMRPNDEFYLMGRVPKQK
jgi:alkylhydroperoxidase family enzyme